MRRLFITFILFSGLLVHGSFLAAANAASLTGKITYEGKVPKIKAINMEDDPDCMSKHSEPPKVQFLVLGDGNTLGNIFVAVKSGPIKEGQAAPSDPVVIDQRGCVYDPHVLGVMAGQTMKFKNSDGILHNVHALPKVNRQFNLAMPGTMKESGGKEFKKVEAVPFKIKCDVHPWMNTWVRVMPHPHFNVTGKDGTYTLDNLPAGTYEIEAWHEKLGFRTQTVTIADGASTTLDFVFKREKKG